MTQGPSAVTGFGGGGQGGDGQAASVNPATAEAFRVLRSRVDLSVLPPLTRAVTEAVVCATADFDYITDLVCDETALAAGVSALRYGTPVVADSAMVAAGISGFRADFQASCQVICKAAEPLAARLARTAGISPAAAGVRLGFAESGPGAVWVVGSAPGAIDEILSRFTHPALVIGVPVGLDGAAAAKDALRASGIPCLSNVSEKGGPDVAAAAFGALLRVAAASAPTPRSLAAKRSRRWPGRCRGGRGRRRVARVPAGCSGTFVPVTAATGRPATGQDDP